MRMGSRILNHKEADSIEIETQAARPSTPIYVMNQAQAQWEDPRLEATLE